MLHNVGGPRPTNWRTKSTKDRPPRKREICPWLPSVLSGCSSQPAGSTLWILELPASTFMGAHSLKKPSLYVCICICISIDTNIDIGIFVYIFCICIYTVCVCVCVCLEILMHSNVVVSLLECALGTGKIISLSFYTIWIAIGNLYFYLKIFVRLFYS